MSYYCDDVLQITMLHQHTMKSTQCLLHRRQSQSGSKLGATVITRVRKSVTQIFREMGPIYFRRAFRMCWRSFQQLFSILKRDLIKVCQPNLRNKSAPNGKVTLTVRLAIAIRFFAGGDPYDISVMFGVSHSVVFDSIDDVIDAVNNCRCLEIKYPESHAEQRQIAHEFMLKSKAGFDCCAGCIDGLLIWTHKPTKEDCEYVGVSETKFYCGRKNKFGLNMQAVCDANKKFLDVSINYGASASDLLAYEVLDLKQEKLDKPGFLADGLCMFGDNAYTNSMTMTTPYPNVSNNQPKDAYNFFHSQLRISIECAFGILVWRWGFLRKKAPLQFSVEKIMATMSCLCRLHNFLIDVGDNKVADPTAEDEWNLVANGGVSFEACRGVPVPMQLMDAGHHQNNDPTRRRRLVSQRDGLFPREAMYERVTELNLRRPVR